ncbi:hypothetical protein, partial [Burkholderia cepacia]|uniref:hypothetical protein n=1 Tax=Burkholderia cepacia TaxID=292 RepID=UPI001E599E33
SFMLKARLTLYQAVPAQAIPIRLSCPTLKTPQQSLGIHAVRLGGDSISYIAAIPPDIGELSLHCIGIKRHTDDIDSQSRYAASANLPGPHHRF